MNKTASCIKMLQVLNCRDLISTNELAEILDTNPRNIREYIKELEACGYSLESIKGAHGGYRLVKGDVLPSVLLDVKERDSLVQALPFLKEKEYEDYDIVENALGRILASGANKDQMTPLEMNEKFPLKMDKALLQYRFSILSESIDSQLKCDIKYLTSQNKLKNIIIHPYKLFVYNGSWFILAWNEHVNDFSYFKLNRIEEINKTRNRFSIMKSYNESEYLDEFGMKKNGEFYYVKLKLKDLNVAIKERVYGKNQIVTEVDANTVILECEMQNKEMIKSFVLSFGSKAHVLAPDWLKQDIKDELWKVIECYE